MDWNYSIGVQAVLWGFLGLIGLLILMGSN